MTVKEYLKQTQSLIDRQFYSDGCTVPLLKKYVHSWLDRSRLLCSAHDYGNLGYIDGVKPGINNQWLTLLAHLSQKNPIYWVWGVIVTIATLPWIVWRRNLGIKFMSITVFHAFWSFLAAIIYLMCKKGAFS
jgi:hypothetical protein